jgi:hypothetical protein
LVAKLVQLLVQPRGPDHDPEATKRIIFEIMESILVTQVSEKRGIQCLLEQFLAALFLARDGHIKRANYITSIIARLRRALACTFLYRLFPQTETGGEMNSKASEEERGGASGNWFEEDNAEIEEVVAGDDDPQDTADLGAEDRLPGNRLLDALDGYVVGDAHLLYESSGEEIQTGSVGNATLERYASADLCASRC